MFLKNYPSKICFVMLFLFFVVNAIASNRQQTYKKKVFLKDRKGKTWDITNAVRKYGFDKTKFRYGLGLGVIKPINKPTFISPGDKGYPSKNEDFEVMGLIIDGVARAYPLSIMIKHEVANDKVGENWFAVTY